MEQFDPRPLGLEQRAHRADRGQSLGVVAAVLHRVEERVVARVGEVRGVGTSAEGLPHRAPEQEQEVLGIRIVRHPTPEVDLVRAAADLVLELVVAGGGDLDVEPEAPPRLDQELVAEPRLYGRVAGVEGETQRAAARGIDPIRVAGLGEQARARSRSTRRNGLR